MAFKNDDPCLAKVGDTEPIFVVRAQDRFAPSLVRLWADLVEAHYAGNRGKTPYAVHEKVASARTLAMRMERWTPRKWPD